MDSELKKSIKNGIWQAVQNVLPKVIKDANFDKTVEGRVIASLGGGLYSVIINNVTYKVPSVDKNATYGVNDIVKVVVQQNDYNKLYIPVQSSSVQVPTAEAVQANLEEHENNTDIHTSASEKTLWNSKLDSNSDGSNLTNTFSAATSRVNLTTGEKISASLGKIAKWFSDLKNVAFSGSYNDLSNKPSIPSALSDLSDDASHRIVTDTEKSIWNSKQNVLSGDITTHYHSSDRSRANHTGTQTASTISDFNDAVSGNSDVSANTNARHTHSNKTVLDNTTASYTTVEQTKLSGIESGANKYVHPTGDGNSHVPATSTTNGGKVLTAGSTANSASWETPTVAWGNISSKPSSSASAIDSAVNEAHTHSNKSVLDSTTASYTTSEKSKLSGIETGANKYTLPAASTSTLGGVKVGANLTISTDGVLNANDNPSSFIIKEEKFIATAGQTVFTLTKGTYEPNANHIFWYWNRVKQDSDALTESSSNTVTLPANTVSAGDEILFQYIELINSNPYPVHGTEHISTGVDPIPDATQAQDGLMPASDKLKLDSIEKGALANKIEVVKQNGTALPISDKAVNVTVPTKTSDITNDSGFITSSASISGNANTATKLATARTISLSGDATGSTTFDGSANKNITTTLANSGVTAGTYPKVSVDAKGRVTSGTSLSVSDIPNITLSKVSNAGTAASKDTGTASGNVPIIGSNGKIDVSVLPAIAITNTYVVDSQADMLALSVQTGDVAVRSDLHKSFILQGTDPSQLDNWQELQTPTDTVQSVAGKTGTVTLSKSDVGLSNVDNTADSTKNVLSATKLATARTIALSGDVTGSITFDGSGNKTITTTVADDSHNHVISNVDGLQNALNSKLNISGGTVNGQLQVLGTAASEPFKVRGIQGIDESGANDSELYLNYNNTYPVYINGNNAVWHQGNFNPDNKVDKISGKGLSTNDYTTGEKNKLSGIESGANKYTLPTASTNSLGGVKVGANLTISSDGTLNANDNPASFIMREEAFIVQNNQRTFTLTKGTYEPNANRIFWYWNRVKQNSDVLIEDSSTTVSFPSGILSNGDEILFDYIEVLNADPLPLHASEHLSDGLDPIPNATESKNGFMSPADKTKLDGIDTSADVNKIETIQKNGSALSISNKTVNITVPTKTSDITNNSGFITSSASISGNASTATKLATARTISLTGDVTGSTSFNGSSNVSISAIVANNSHTHTVSNISDLTATASELNKMHGTTASTTELNYVNGVTSSIQNQLNDRIRKAIDISGTDLNTVIDPNFYFAGGGNTCTHKPDNCDAFGMIVFQSADGWHTQILCDSDQNNKLYWRTGMSPITASWKTIVDSNIYIPSDILSKLKAVDGSGSGLDADLLDGKQASSFATSAQGTKADNALPASSYNASDVLAKLKTVDGAGSGLNADVSETAKLANKLGNAVLVSDYNHLSPSLVAQGTVTPIQAPNTANAPWNNTTSGFLMQSNSSDSFHLLIFRSGGDGWAYRSYYQGVWNSWKIWATQDSPAFTGTPTAPTPSTGTNTNQLATTKFVQNSLSAGGYGDMLKSQYDTDNDGVVDKAEKLSTARTISLSGIVQGSTTFDGSANKNITTTLSDIGGLRGSLLYHRVTGLSTTEDLPAPWRNVYPISIDFFSGGSFYNQPSTWGLTLTISQGSDYHVFWATQSSGSILHRGGNSSGWGSGWKTIADSANLQGIANNVGLSATKLDGNDSSFYKNIQISASQPSNQRAGDLWFQVV